MSASPCRQLRAAVRLNWVTLIGCVTATGLAFASGDADRSSSTRPNIVFLLTDDQRADTLGAYGNQIIRTPHLDRLAAEGSVFRNAYSPNPVCITSRAEILTGASGFRNGILPPYSNQLDRELATLPAALSDAGYHACYVGKWHTQGRPLDAGFQECLGLFGGGMASQAPQQFDFKGIEVTGYRGWVFQSADGRDKFPELGIGLTADISERFADAAVEFIRRRPDEPYFLQVNFTAPHDPLIFPTGYETSYRPDEIPLPENFLPEHPFDHGNLDGRDERMLPFPRTPEGVRENLAAYYAVIEHLDRQIGRILEALDETDQERETVVIFSSDHGLAVGSHGLMGKQNMYEHTVRVPLVLRGPGIPEGAEYNALVYLRDLFPTICDWATIETPSSVDGQSLMPILAGESQGREYVFAHFADSQRMVRDARWKLAHYPLADETQLFDLANDPDELRDLADAPEHQNQRQRLERVLLQWRRDQRDPGLDPWQPVDLLNRPLDYTDVMPK